MYEAKFTLKNGAPRSIEITEETKEVLEGEIDWGKSGNLSIGTPNGSISINPKQVVLVEITSNSDFEDGIKEGRKQIENGDYVELDEVAEE